MDNKSRQGLEEYLSDREPLHGHSKSLFIFVLIEIMEVR